MTARAQGEPEPKPRLFATLRDDVRVVTQDVMRRGVSQSVGGTLSELERFYLSREDQQRLSRLRPVRRTMPADRLVRPWAADEADASPAHHACGRARLFIFGFDRIDVDTVHLSLRLHLVGGLLLFLVLMLELKDKLVARDELEAGRRVQLALMPNRARPCRGGTCGCTPSRPTTSAATSSTTCRWTRAVTAMRSATSPARRCRPRC